MEPLVVTSEHLRAARKAGACESVDRYREGTPIHKIRSDHLKWYAEKFPEIASVAASQLMAGHPLGFFGFPPLEMFGSGDGSGSGYGSGYGYGSGSGDGSGYGSGYGEPT